MVEVVVGRLLGYFHVKVFAFLVLLEEGGRDGGEGSLVEVLYEELCVPGEEGVDLAHEFKTDEDSTGHLNDIFVGIVDAFDGCVFAGPFDRILLEDVPFGLVLVQQMDELIIVNQTLLTAD